VADYDAAQFEPVLVPHFPVAAFTPSSACPHNGRYRRGSVLCCMSCHQSGKDHMPIFRHVVEPPDLVFKDEDLDVDPFLRATRERFMQFQEPVREVSAAPSVPAPEPPKETRKERRRRMFGEIAQAMSADASPAA
jgi:hypothetical protein